MKLLNGENSTMSNCTHGPKEVFPEMSNIGQTGGVSVCLSVSYVLCCLFVCLLCFVLFVCLLATFCVVCLSVGYVLGC